MSDKPTQEQVMFSLKERAKRLGITFHPNIGEDKLREKIDAKMELLTSKDPMTTGEVPINKPKTTAHDKLNEKRKRASELVRVVITCFDPNKKEWQGEYFSVINSKIGKFKKMVPYGVEWHVPRIMLEMIESKQVQTFRSYKDSKGREHIEPRLIKAYGVEYLDPLTPDEMAELAKIQMATGRLED